LYSAGIPTVHLVGPRVEEAGQPERVAAKTGLLDHIAFSANGLAAMRARLTAHGVAFQERLVPRDGQTQIFLHDPNGIAVELNYAPGEGAAT
jgi:catechol 2,3-dioxygenase-like lactoylglutathione lyase family enzyme